MKDKKKLKKIAAKSVKLLHNHGKANKDNIEGVVKHLHTLPRAQAIYTISKFIKGLRRKSKEGTAVIESVFPLSKKQMNSIVEKLKEEFFITGVENKVNPEILGGIKVRIGDTVLDYSVNNKLSQVGRIIQS